MNDRRRRILGELNLLPVWQSRFGIRDHCHSMVATQSGMTPLAASIVPTSTPISQMNWDQLRQTVSQCVKCPLHQARRQTVFGVGDEKADWLFVGEGPGAREDELGEPFVGQAGKLLDQMLAAIQLQRGVQVYIANIVKCRPPNNRNPSSEEAKQCEPYLTRQIELIQPRLIVALGKVAAQNLLYCDDSISSLRGKIHHFAGIPLIVTYHPAYLLRSLPEKAKAWKDLCFAKATMQALS
ncbi:MAG: uracil-DNA glycosylase [Nitrosomonas sp.]|nr:MAG: uracil-DNA glycosylase [Nitrosomonas sp.]